MLNPPSKPGADIVGSYRAADEAARKAAREATEGFHKAQQAGDMAAAQHWADSLKATMEALKEFRASLSPRDQFIAKYQIEAINDHTVSLTLPAESSRYGFLKEAQEIAQSALGRDAVIEYRLSLLASDKRFAAPLLDSALVRIDGSVDQTSNMSKEQQSELLATQGLRLPSTEDLMVAHAAFLILSKGDLFRGSWVRSATDTLRFNDSGLGMDPTDGNGPSTLTRAAASLHTS